MKKSLLIVFILAMAAGISLKAYSETQDHLVVYYFHTTFRCHACSVIEKSTESALKNAFADDLESGRLVYKPVNIDEKQSRHFVKDYQLYTKSVVLSLIKDGKEARFKNLDKVWQYLRNRDQFSAYIQQETSVFLNEL